MMLLLMQVIQNHGRTQHGQYTIRLCDCTFYIAGAYFTGAVRRNGLTQDTNNGQLEVAPRKWFTGARNRDGGRQEKTPAGV